MNLLHSNSVQKIFKNLQNEVFSGTKMINLLTKAIP